MVRNANMLRCNFFIIGLLFLSFSLFAGCGRQSASPLISGKAVSGTIWERPVASPGETGSNTGSPIAAGSRVEIYENFIIVTPPKGPCILSPHGWYTDLRYEKD
jgi:hypothetical protein